MLSEIFIFLFFYILIIISIIGYGLSVGNILRLNLLQTNIGIIGLLGLFFLALISYFTHLFFSHGYTHNLIINFIGNIIFFFFIFKNPTYFKKHLLKLVLFTLLFLPGLFISKNHDDFPYYHLPYILNLIENKIQFGLGNLNIAFRTPSSLFYIQSLFYFPFLKYYLVHSLGLIILIFTNLILIEFIFYKNNNYFKNFLKILSSLSFLFINIQFWRLSEFGTDRGGQLISLIVFLYIFIILNDNKNRSLFLQNVKILIVFLIFLISIKSYFLSYTVLLIIIFYKVCSENLIKKILSDFFLILLIFIFILLFSIVNLSNSGCLFYPLQFTCYYNFLWSIDQKEVFELSKWYEIWSKSGAGPNFRVENPENYIKGLNWITGWFTRYFLNKPLDVLGLIFVISLFYSVLIKFNSKYIIKKVIYLPVFLAILTLFFVWFLKHPDLRYGGFILLGVIFFVPLSLYLSNFLLSNFKKKVLALVIILVIISYPLRNIYRINQELNRNDNFKYNSFPYFHVEKIKYKEKTLGENNINFYLSEDPWCWATPSPCSTDNNINVKNLYGYNIFFKKK